MQKPLAIRLRPTKLDEVFGQQHLIGENMLLRRCVEQSSLFSIIFYGPPGCGKTTLALALAEELNIPYRFFSAVEGNKKDLVSIFEKAKLSNGLILIIDEIHRLNKDKQDLLLPVVESGLITLIGATTSNPFFAISPANDSPDGPLPITATLMPLAGAISTCSSVPELRCQSAAKRSR